MTLTRRDFVKSGFTGVSLVLFSTRLSAETLFAAPGRTLVIVQLIGGNDTLNTFIPYTDPRYRAARPALAIPDASILQIDSRIGLHPSMQGLFEMYQQRKFAFITNVGFSTLDRSHFRCEDVWQTANEDPSVEPRGWVGRWADLYAADPYSPAMSVGVSSKSPRGLLAQRVLPTCLVDLDSFQVEGDADPQEAERFAISLRRIYGQKRSDAVVDAIRQQGNNAFEASDLFHALPPPSVVIPYRDTPLAQALKLAAQVIAGRSGSGVIWVTIGGFDTHANQVSPPSAGGSAKGSHANLLGDVSDSLTSFQRDLEQRGVADRAMVLGWSEFGRRVQENASFGTDHGKAGSVFVLGTSVRGGEWYGDGYDLADLDEGDLKPRIDFRSVYATTIRDWLGGDPALVLGSTYEQLGFISERRPRRRAVGR